MLLVAVASGATSRRGRRWRLPALRAGRAELLPICCRAKQNEQKAKSGGSMRKRQSVFGPWLVILLLAALPAPAAAQAPAVTVFEGARLITGDGNAPIEDSAFLV